MGLEQEEDWEVALPAEDDEPDPSQSHHKLLNAVSQLYNKQRVGVPKRREPAVEISEFHLSTAAAGTEDSEELKNRKKKKAVVSIKQLTRPLLDKPLHKHIPDKIKSLSLFTGPNKTLEPPVEKVHADKATRAVGFNKVKDTLTRWDAIIQRNRAADQLRYPIIKHEKVQSDPADFLTTFKTPSDLELQMAAILKGSAVIQEEKKAEEDLYPLSIEEMVEKRRLMAKIRAQESYRISKAARQNKIKSKKYHRFLRHERTKQELKAFETLKETDPEAALEKLEQLERARAEERASLRHKNTGHWAKSKAIRAKYDKDARIELAEQLAKSRELTKKLKSMDSSSEEDNVEEEQEEIIGTVKEQTYNREEAENNPWVNGSTDHQEGSEIKEFVEGFKQYCDMKKRNKIEEENEIKKRESLPKIKRPPLCPDESSDEEDEEMEAQKNVGIEISSEDEFANEDTIVSTIESRGQGVTKKMDADDKMDSEPEGKNASKNSSNEQNDDREKVDVFNVRSQGTIDSKKDSEENIENSDEERALSVNTIKEQKVEDGKKVDGNSDKQEVERVPEGNKDCGKLENDENFYSKPETDLDFHDGKGGSIAGVTKTTLDDTVRSDSNSGAGGNLRSQEKIQPELGVKLEEAKYNGQCKENMGVDFPEEQQVKSKTVLDLRPDANEEVVVTKRGIRFVVSCTESGNPEWEPSPKKTRRKRYSSQSFQEEVLNKSGLWKLDPIPDSKGETKKTKVRKHKTSGDSSSSKRNSTNISGKFKKEVMKINKGECSLDTERVNELKKSSEIEAVTESFKDKTEASVVEDSIKDQTYESNNAECSSSSEKAKKVNKDSENVPKMQEVCIEDTDLKTQVKTKKDIGTIEEIFKSVEYSLGKVANEKIQGLKQEMADQAKYGRRRKPSEGERNEEEESFDKLAMKKKLKFSSEIDEALIELADDRVSSSRSVDVEKLLAISGGLSSDGRESIAKPATKPTPQDIDPEKFLKMKPKLLATQIPELVTEGAGEDAVEDPQEEEELGEEEQRRMNLAEAFADDDVVDQFRKDKEEEIKESQPAKIDLSLPGWGEWAGASIPKTKQVSRRKQRKFIFKPPQEIRRDRNKGNIIINEEGNQKIRQHMVSELPGHFTSVKEFEASVRAPLGSTWVPQTAHDRLTAPPVITKMGAIIQPMDESQLVNNPDLKSGEGLPPKRGPRRKPSGKGKPEGSSK